MLFTVYQLEKVIAMILFLVDNCIHGVVLLNILRDKTKCQLFVFVRAEKAQKCHLRKRFVQAPSHVCD